MDLPLQQGNNDIQMPIRSRRHDHSGQVRVIEAELDAPCARWSRVLPDGSYQLDPSKLKCLLSEEECNDRLFVRNVIHGTILSSQVYPLIFDPKELVEEQMVRLRSLCFFTQLLADREQGALTYKSLDDEQKTVVAVGVRDLFLAASRGLLDENETGLLHGVTGLLDETLGCVEVMGMNISFHPSTNFRVMKHIDLTDDEELGPEWSPLFARVMDVPKLITVFVDPVELSYHNMENIVPLDRWLECKLTPGSDYLSASLENTRQVQAGREVWTCRLRGAGLCNLLKQVSALKDLYTAPLNKASRGGERFIFHSTHLSKALTEAVKKSALLRDESKLAQGQLASSFQFVNYVFRCNKFAPGDSMFVNHRDTPYYDGQQRHVSKYTVLIYLTTGKGNPALHVHDVDLTAIDEEMTCVIFDQRYEHEGKPFIDNEKIFIRSELIFEDAGLEHNSDISSLFSEACYMTRQSLLNDSKGLDSYANDCFERANSLHWAVEREASQPPVYLHKQFGGIQFLTNGYNYWFAKSSGSSSSAVNEVDCAVVAVMDHLNGKVNGKPFNSLCDTRNIVHSQFKSTKNIWEYLLHNKTDVKAAPFKRLEAPDIESLINKGPDGKGLDIFSRDFETSDEEKDEEDDDEEGDDDEEEGDSEEGKDGKDVNGDEYGNGEIEGSDYFTCCPDCHPKEFSAWRSPLVRRSYRKSWQFTRAALLNVPLLAFNEELVINESNVKVEGDKIFFLGNPDSKPRPRVNFAGCWDSPFGSVPQYMDVEQEIGAMNLQVPPILWHEFEEGYQLVLDLFRNDWMAKSATEVKIPVPVITNNQSDKGEARYMKKLQRVHRSGWFEPLFDTLNQGLDSSSHGLLADEWSDDEKDVSEIQ